MPQMSEQADVGLVNGTELAVALGRVEENVKHIRDNTERRLNNAEQFQLTVRDEIAVLSGRVTAVESSLGTSLKWVTVVLTVTTIGVNVIMRLL